MKNKYASLQSKKQRLRTGSRNVQNRALPVRHLSIKKGG
jgi:hypothetical protein